MALDTLPILDLAELDAGAEAAARFREQLRQVTHEVGFFFLVGHGIPERLVDELLEVSRRFFALPEADKLAVENIHSPQFRGYTRVGKELTNGDVDWREQLDIGPEREVREDAEPAYWALEGPNLWPAALPELEPIVAEWSRELGALALRLLRAWAVALGEREDVFDAAFADHPFPLIKVVRYPGTSDPDDSAGNQGGQQGVGAHRDGGVLTLLLVEPEKGGLQVEHDGEWIDAPSLPGAFVVNIGEMLELATDGYLKATLHRVISPVVGTDRISIPYFFNPALDATMPKLVLDPALQAEKRGVTADPTDSPILETYGDNVWRYRLRAHPNVAAIHYPDAAMRSGD
jgi:isopenicillin N synthase-like dioxygenase